jgi:hypothetical protein
VAEEVSYYLIRVEEKPSVIVFGERYQQVLGPFETQDEATGAAKRYGMATRLLTQYVDDISMSLFMQL